MAKMTLDARGQQFAAAMKDYGRQARVSGLDRRLARLASQAVPARQALRQIQAALAKGAATTAGGLACFLLAWFQGLFGFLRQTVGALFRVSGAGGSSGSASGGNCRGSPGTPFGFAVACALAAAIAVTPVQHANATAITPTQIGNFLVTGFYHDNEANFTIKYTGVINSGNYGNRIDLSNVFFGGGMTNNRSWDTATSINSDMSTNYDLRSRSIFMNIRGPPFNMGFDYAPLADGTAVPSGIGSEALDSSLALTIYDARGDPIYGTIAAPLSLTQAPQVPPALVPEPGSMLLLGTGLAGLISARRKLKA